MLHRMIKSLTLSGLAASLMYLFDPDIGRRRRSLLRDKMTHARHKIRNAADISIRDLEHRLYGTYCELRAKFRGRDSSDRVVEDRVRAKMGHYISHPSSIAVRVRDGHVMLSGPALASEVASLVAAVKSVDGVRTIENRLEVHESRENTAALQGGLRRTGERATWMQANWSPTARLVAGTTGAAMMINCLAKRTAPATMLGTAGLFLFLRAIRNRPVTRFGEISSRGSQKGRMAKKRLSNSGVPAGPNTPQVEVEDATNLSAAIPRGRRRTADELADDIIDEASMESFPASDAPAFSRR